ncbi:MAG: cation-translocating P-type ATPase [Novosphingobium sp.]
MMTDGGRNTPLPAAKGLGASEAAERLQAEGFNELPRQGHRGFVRIVLDVLREPMLAMLLGAGLIYLALGDLQDALILLAFAGLSIVITIVQETRTERALEALRDLASPRALVIRDGQRVRIAGREVVRGDLVVLAEGDRVPADGWLTACDALHVDESLLTGESFPVRKASGSPEGLTDPPHPGGDDLPFVFSGSLVVRGTGLCVVTATGAHSEIGRIGRVLSTLDTETPRLRLQTRRLVLWFAAAGAAASALVTLLYGLFRGGWLEAALAGIALGMSMLPEEFPVVLTIFMAMGAMRMSRNRVLTRRAAAIETLGATTVLCTDKTGTLTQNRMQVAEARLPDGRMILPQEGATPLTDDAFRHLAELGRMASAQHPSDPMEQALHAFADQTADRSGSGLPQSCPVLRRHYPLHPSLLAMSQAWDDDEASEGLVVAAKGAPEAIAELCGMDAAAQAGLKVMIDAMAGKGLRVLGIAEARWADGALPPSQRDFAFAFRGLIGFADPLREAVPDAVSQCRKAGIRIIMITGDYPQTALAIAQQAGIDAHDVLTGEALAAMPDEELRRRIGSVSVCARVMPEQKLRLVETLKGAGEIVAMTGDGVNDAPSLKAAHIGIAMGGRGTDVAREVSSMVLLDDDFGSIVKAVRMGRRIYDNLRKAMGFIVAVHIPIAGLALLPLLTGMPLLLGPIHIALLEMIIDPVCSLVFEAETEEHDVMARPPRRPDSTLFSRSLVGWSIVQGVMATAVTAGLTWYFRKSGMDEAQLRSSAFCALVLAIVALILVNRRYSASLVSALRRANPALGIVFLAVSAVLLATQLLPPVASLLRFEPVGLGVAGITVIAASGMLIALERLKPLWSRQLVE